MFILFDPCPPPRLVDVGRKADKADHTTLALCALHLRQLKARTYATELYRSAR